MRQADYQINGNSWSEDFKQILDNKNSMLYLVYLESRNLLYRLFFLFEPIEFIFRASNLKARVDFCGGRALRAMIGLRGQR